MSPAWDRLPGTTWFPRASRRARPRAELSHSRASEGGEVFLAQGHLQVHRTGEPSDFPALCSASGDAFDGFLPVTLHFRGYSMVLIVDYGIASLGFVGENAQKLVRLGTFVSLLQSPW
eukprot:4418664-Pyramimonas_sp.AAC.1